MVNFRHFIQSLNEQQARDLLALLFIIQAKLMLHIESNKTLVAISSDQPSSSEPPFSKQPPLSP